MEALLRLITKLLSTSGGHELIPVRFQCKNQ